jgi:molybdate transport system substrate-binding protein
MMRIAALLVAPATVLVATLTGCGSSSNPRILVFAAASVKKTFTEIGERFQTENPGASIDFSVGGSSDLVTQLTHGATADAFASADTKNMDKAADAGLLAGEPVNLASNTYPAAVLKSAPEAGPAQEFVNLVTGEVGRKVLSQAGSGKP